jgi:hypothetical protein
VAGRDDEVGDNVMTCWFLLFIDKWSCCRSWSLATKNSSSTSIGPRSWRHFSWLRLLSCSKLIWSHCLRPATPAIRVP